jgi:hypothetical protein
VLAKPLTPRVPLIRTAIITARSAPLIAEVIASLRRWGVTVDEEAFFVVTCRRPGHAFRPHFVL